ncbi:UdgX family uracil-DNA binding protein [uncultured Jatrophihabitans sp.]|uniref:UdgX family uracil-DNA binding protein n=1 Tax=uncultured Jatrophihabitans sp. TaxID=1610747 RepID=UPI0035C9B926
MTRPSYIGAGEFLPSERTLVDLAAAARDCRGCELYQDVDGTVFGEGPATARLMLVGEQPGDVEDREGRPFVGPAGEVLARALADAGLSDTPYYVTNAVKHFRWKPAPRGKRRIHQTPSAAQSTACRPWLAAELAAVRPTVLVALGATASASLLGPAFRLTQNRGVDIAWPPDRGSFAGDETPVPHMLATVHPSAVLRAPDEDREQTRAGLVSDLRLAAELLTGH